MTGFVAGATVVGAGLSYAGSKSATKAAERGAQQAYDADMASLDYLKETEALPQEAREQALRGLMDYYQVPGEQLDQQGLIDQARNSPLYNSIMGTRQSGEDAILRNASATGGLRSGNSNQALYDYNVQLENDALLQSFMQEQERQDYERGIQLQGLSGLAQLPSNVNNIAGMQSQAGQTRAMGTIGAAQTQQAGRQNMIDTALSGFTGAVALNQQNKTLDSLKVPAQDLYRGPMRP